MIRRPPRSTLDRSSAASDVYKRQVPSFVIVSVRRLLGNTHLLSPKSNSETENPKREAIPVSYTHLRAHETVLDLVCRLLLEKKNKTNKQKKKKIYYYTIYTDTKPTRTTYYRV